MRRSINTIAGKGDQNLSSALDVLPDLHVRFTTNNDNDKKKTKKFFRNQSSIINEFDRQFSTIHRKIDQFQVNYCFVELTYIFEENSECKF